MEAGTGSSAHERRWVECRTGDRRHRELGEARIHVSSKKYPENELRTSEEVLDRLTGAETRGEAVEAWLKTDMRSSN